MTVLAQPEMVTLSVSVDYAPAGREFSSHEGLSSGDFLRQRATREKDLPRC
jgi:hypothetical protein